MRALVTVTGQDSVGIIAAVCNLLAELNINIRDINQTVMDEFFTMNMHIEVSSMSCSIHQLEENIKAALPGVEVHVMHENIFTSMHSI